jgi:hypothetical protein
MAIDNWTILSDYALRRRKFDPSKVEDLKALRHFMKTSSWKDGGCPFYLEWPYQDVVSMCQTKYTAYMLYRLGK